MIDPLGRWQPLGDKPDYAGLLTYGGAPYTEDPAELAGVDVAIVGAPMDDLVSDRPGTRFAPRAIQAASCPPGRHLEAKVDAFQELRIVDYGDAPVIPADAEASHAAIERVVGEVAHAGAVSVVLGGDHSVTEPKIRALAARHGPLGLVHFDTHTDTGARYSASSARTGRRCSGSWKRDAWIRRGTSRSGCGATGPARPSSRGRRSTGSRPSSCTTCASSGYGRWWSRRSASSATASAS